jgi:peptidyl-prolyl cis-trans isomerase SurA
MTKIKACLIIALVACLLQSALVGTGAAEVVDRIVAVVNNDIITMSELENMARSVQAQSGIKPTKRDAQKMQRDMLEALIDRKLAKVEAKRRGIKVESKEVDEAVADFKKRGNIPDDETLAKALSHEGLSLKEFRQQIADQLLQERLMAVVMRPKVSINDAEVRRVYEERFKRGGTQVHLLTLRLPFPPGATNEQKDEIKQKAETILSAVKRGESLRQAAGKFSLTPSDVGFVAQTDLDPRLAEYLGRLKPKEFAPVETPEGYQLIQVMGRRSGDPPPFEKVAPQIRDLLMQQEMGKYFMEWVKTLREKAHIRIML